jgi:mannose-6-phosphate isomerase-like protein (cupin superfamily)
VANRFHPLAGNCIDHVDATEGSREETAMITFNQSSVPARPSAPGVLRQRLLTDERVKNSPLRLERLTLAAGATMKLKLSAQSLGWLQLLDGKAKLEAHFTEKLSDTHSVVLPPNFDVTLSTTTGATLLYVELPDAGRLDPGFAAEPPLFMVVNWMREPVLQSQSDERKRVSLVAPDTCRTKAMRAQMVIYPAGSMGTDCRHEGADAIMVFVSGSGTAWVNGQPTPVAQGDVMVLPEGDRYHLKAADDGEMRYLVFYAPGEFKTVATGQGKLSAWRSTDRDISGRETAIDDKQRRAFAQGFAWSLTFTSR